MKRLPIRVLPWTAGAALLILAVVAYSRTATRAAADGGGSQPSALVNIAPLVRGNLPSLVTIYGSVGSAATARHVVIAPLQAEISDVYVRNGAVVAAGAPLLRLQPTPATRGAYAQAQSALQLAAALAARTQAMVTDHLATSAQLLQAQSDVTAAALNLTTLKSQGAGGPDLLTAPFAALVTNVSAIPGGMVAAGDTLMQLARPDGLALQAGAVAGKAAMILVGNPVTLTPLGGGPALVGAVTFRAATVDPSNGEVAVEISLQAGQALLGQMFRADITVGQLAGYVVPHGAVLVDDGGATYIVQNQNGTAKVIDIQVLGSDADRDVVSGPVIAGAPVVLAGNYQLNDGDSLRVATGAAPAQGAPGP